MRRSLPFFFSVLVVVACAKAPPPKAPEAAAAEPAGPQVQAVSAVIVANECGEKQNAKAAQHNLDRLVSDCHSVPHGSASFGVVLHPGGRMEFTPAEGEKGDAEIPMCVVAHKLSHDLKLTTPCKLEVRLAESQMPAPH